MPPIFILIFFVSINKSCITILRFYIHMCLLCLLLNSCYLHSKYVSHQIHFPHANILKKLHILKKPCPACTQVSCLTPPTQCGKHNTATIPAASTRLQRYGPFFTPAPLSDFHRLPCSINSAATSIHHPAWTDFSSFRLRNVVPL